MVEGNKSECGMYNRENYKPTGLQTAENLSRSGLYLFTIEIRETELKGDLTESDLAILGITVLLVLGWRYTILQGLGCRLSIQPLKDASSGGHYADESYPVTPRESADPNLEATVESNDLRST